MENTEDKKVDHQPEVAKKEGGAEETKKVDSHALKQQKKQERLAARQAASQKGAGETK